MPLKIYRDKRNFAKTKEPKGTLKQSKCYKNVFIIQKHAASHLHYDFRLELNGVLLSWAVPKGPSLDPKVKRLAVHVEDHPVEYAYFEGTIPEGEYGGGTVMLWDRGKWQSEDDDIKKAYKKGNMTFTLHAEKLNGAWKLIRLKNDDKHWLLIKLDDEYAKSSNYDITKEAPNSVNDGQTMKEITATAKKSWMQKGKVSKKKIQKK